MKDKFHWKEQVSKGFETSKEKIATQFVLSFLSFSKLFTVECDANNIGVGAVLSQENIPMVFHSEKINKAKKRYSSYNFALHALVKALRK